MVLALCFSCWVKLLAQAPVLPTKATLSNTLFSAKTITSSTQIDTVVKPLALGSSYTVEVNAKVTAASGRGLDIEARNSSFNGFRLSLADTVLRWTAPLTAPIPLSTPIATQDQIIRVAVKNDSAYIFHNGAYIKVQPITSIKDIVGGVESDSTPSVTKVGANLVAGWAGIAPNNTGKPSDYGWGYTGATVTNLFSVANGSSGSRYTDVSSTVNTHTYNGSTYNGRLLFIRWDASTTSGTVYNYQVVLKANTTYDFSMLHAYFSNATGAKTITAGIGKTVAATDRYATHVYNTSGTKSLKREDFFFTSQEAGVYYLTFTGDWGLFTIGELALNEVNTNPGFIFGKNYPTGAVNIQINSVTYDDGAYAPTTLVTGAVQNVTITGRVASRIPAANTNFIVAGKTDFHLTGDFAPFINGTVALNAEDAWLFFDNVKPAVVIANWLGNVTINGAPALNNPNVRIANYKNGTVIIPNGNVTSTKAMEVFTQPGLGGSTKLLEIETYYDSLASFDNKIRSFVLHRGYMATVANNKDGSGYSRVFIANDSDLVVNTMPAALDTTISFIRVFKWDWVSRKGWGGGGTPLELVNATWYYDWSAGGSPSVNYNYAMIRHNAGWPSWESIHARQGINSLLGFNEPDQADQANMSVDLAIKQWPEMMKSGQRIGSPAPANPLNSWISNFINKCDELNYRVDYVAIHCYWNSLTPQGWYDRLKGIYDRVKRPIWITEWNNGANWTGETWPTDTSAQFLKQYNDIKGILQVLDTASFIERYALYNWVENKRAMVLADTLTMAGKYYAANRSTLAFTPAREHIHEWKLSSPLIDTVINPDDYFKVTLSFRDINGELGSQYILERKIDGRDTGFLPVQTYTGYVTGSVLNYVDSVYSKATYRVKAYNKAGNQFVYSTTLVVVRDVAPVAPTSLTGTVLSTKKTSLTWNAGTNARSYNIKRATSSGGPFLTILARTTLLSCTDSLLSPGTTYYYVVTSLNAAGESANSTVLSLRTNDLVAPATVQSPRIASGDTKITLTWDFMYDAKYEIFRASTVNGTYTVIATNVDAVRYEDLNLTNGTTYYYKIVAFNTAGRSAETAVLTGTPVMGQYVHIGFNENTGTVAADDWGGYHATLNNAATWSNGKDSTTGAVTLVKASSSYMQLASGVVSTLNNFTIAAWINLPANQGNNTRLFDFGNDGATFMVLIPKSGTNVRYKITCAAGTYDRSMPYQLPPGQWVHVAISQQGAIFKFYVNGQLQYTDSSATVKPADMGVTTKNYLGKSQFSNDPYSDHVYDDFRIYNYALTDQNVSNLVTGGALRIATAVTTVSAKTPAQDSTITGSWNKEIKVYPNPAADFLKVSGLNFSKRYTYVLYTAMGVRIVGGSLKNGTIELPKNLAVGMYTVQLIDNNHSITNKLFVIKK